MLTAKIFEMRDRATPCTALALKLAPFVPGVEAAYIKDAGWYSYPGFVVVSIRGGVTEAQNDAYQWSNARTWRTAHIWIEEHWNDLPSGSLIDVRTILGETSKPCASAVTRC